MLYNDSKPGLVSRRRYEYVEIVTVRPLFESKIARLAMCYDLATPDHIHRHAPAHDQRMLQLRDPVSNLYCLRALVRRGQCDEGGSLGEHNHPEHVLGLMVQ